jgi:DNA topoisomerase-3
MVVRRFLAAFYPDAVFATTRIETEVAGEHMFVTRGRMRKEAGWQEVEPTATERTASAKEAKDASKDAGKDAGKGKKKGEQDAGPALPLVHEGDEVGVERAKLHEGQTQPPRRFTESTLLGSMERAGQELDDEAMRRAMKEAGLGTPATRASMIETLLRRQYIEREGKALVPTAAGRALIEAIPTDDLKSAALTGQWEARLARVAGGKVTRAEFMEETRGLCTKLVRELLSQRVELPAGAAGTPGEVLGRCPICRAEVTESFHVFSCGNNKTCTFVIFKKVAGKEIKPNLVKLLLSGKTSQVFKGFRSKSGKSFEAALRLGEEGKVELVFDQEGAARAPRAASSRDEAPVEDAPVKKPRAKKAAAPAPEADEAPAKKPRARKAAAPAPEVRAADPVAADAPVKKPRARKAAPAAVEVAPLVEVRRKPAPAPAPLAAASSPEGMSCPMCKEGALMRGKRGWGCTRWREGCRFVIWQRDNDEARSDREIAEIVQGLTGG